MFKTFVPPTGRDSLTSTSYEITFASPGFSVPKFHATLPPDSFPPFNVLVCKYLSSKSSRKLTFVASVFPLFMTVSVYVISCPGVTACGIFETVSPTQRSGWPKAMFPFQFPNTFISAKTQLRPMTFVFTIFTTFATACASPVCTVPPAPPFPFALFCPVNAKTLILFFMSAELLLVTVVVPPFPKVLEAWLSGSLKSVKPFSVSVQLTPSGAE